MRTVIFMSAFMIAWAINPINVQERFGIGSILIIMFLIWDAIESIKKWKTFKK